MFYIDIMKNVFIFDLCPSVISEETEAVQRLRRPVDPWYGVMTSLSQAAAVAKIT